MKTTTISGDFEIDLKKALYKEKPTAVNVDHFDEDGETHQVYMASLELGWVVFIVPESDMGIEKFGSSVPGQLLIRWMTSFAPNN